MSFVGHGHPGVFAGPDAPGVFSGCCCGRKAILSLKRNGTSPGVTMVCVEDRGDEGGVAWTRELDTTGLASPVWYGGQVYVAHTPAVGTDSILRIRDKDGSLMTSRALGGIFGGAIGSPALAVADGKVFVFAFGPFAGPDAWRLKLDLSTEIATAIAGEPGEFFPFPSALTGAGRQRLVSIDGGSPRIACGSFALQVTPDLTVPRVGAHPALWSAPARTASAPTIGVGGADVLIAENGTGGGLWNHHTHSNPPGTPSATRITTDIRGTFAASAMDGFTFGHAWVPISNTEIAKVSLGGAATYTKTLGVDFLTGGTWGTNLLDILRDDKKRLWVLARSASNAILALYEEDGTDWIEKWQLDLMTDPAVEWTDPDLTSFRGWTLNIPGGGYEPLTTD